MAPRSPTLPIHRDDLGQRTRFDKPQQRGAFINFWRELVKRFTVSSTGAPTDGMGDDSETNASVAAAFPAARKQAGTEKDGGDWFVNEVVLTGEDDQHYRLDREKAAIRPSESPSSSLYRGTSGGIHQYQGGVLEWLRWRCWPAVLLFFDPKFEDSDRETEFQKHFWFSSKALSFYGSLYLILNWVLYLIMDRSVTHYEKITYYGGLTFFTLPIPFMVAANFPRKYGIFFQIWFCIAVWYCGITEVIQMKQCGFYTDDKCGGKDFLAMLYYNTALPAMMMFIVSRRFYNFIAQLVVLILFLVLVVPIQALFVRNVISFIIFSIFIQGLNYAREMGSLSLTRITSSRSYCSLKDAYRAQQKAQIAESKASDSKRRFASYIFHEVRVPLNTAMLAYQNLRSSNGFKDEHNNSIEIYALEVSLTMMQQVLNDVLDLQKMDAGKFESSPRPFPLHRAINSIMGPIAVATTAKSLNLRVDFDERIDQVSSPYNASEGVWVVGDEIRLRQVLTNLASNAVKFTPEGNGEVRVTTRLLAPLPRSKPDSELEVSDELAVDNPLLRQIDGKCDMLVVRIEVQDGGPGIQPSDLVDNRLFQPFVQTRVGKRDGSGSGLGLAIVQQIVSLSGGRLGVQSRKGDGAMFWVEFSYPMATIADVQATRNTHTTTPTPPISLIPTQTLTLDPRIYAIDNEFMFPLTMPALKRSRSSPPRTRPLPSMDAMHGMATSPQPPLHHNTSPALLEQVSAKGEASTDLIQTDDALRILVVDDDPLTRTLMTRMLAKLGCVVETADDGRQCLDILLKPPLDGVPPRSFDLVSLDNQMPVMTGEETVRELRSLGRKDLVVGCTGNALTEDQASYMEAGADRILTKPIMIK
ncbi:hypothetical protein JAAARDRAFT_57408 [Jaapia argillacea MUCL 33604]|uniref:histidine kinase n=1 Tax=Jaapia argillacea MUCL 33604 TaxID=933084 RepID=A0A067Q4S0_9AGAM|nr:hypothetical protein JAAARDRAFT_57408 [Jaapia argillacea MUCL 33604]